MNVLLVEPDSTLGETYATALQASGYDVRVCKDAQAAIMAADQATPDLVLLELQLRGHSGIEFLHEFRSYTEWAYVPVMFLTFVPEESVRVPEQLGVVGHLYKPLTTLKDLLRRVGEVPLVT